MERDCFSQESLLFFLSRCDPSRSTCTKSAVCHFTSHRTPTYSERRPLCRFLLFVSDARVYIWRRTWTDSLMNRRLIYLLDARPALFRSALHRPKALIQNWMKFAWCDCTPVTATALLRKCRWCELEDLRALFPFGAVPRLLNLLAVGASRLCWWIPWIP